jgi:alanyl-tRNA synthetase
MTSTAKVRKTSKATDEDVHAQVERLQAQIEELQQELQRLQESNPSTGSGRASRASDPATKGQKLEAAADYGVSKRHLERFIEKLDDQAEKDAKAGRLVPYTGRNEDLFGD